MLGFINKIEEIIFDPLCLLKKSINRININVLKKNIELLSKSLSLVEENIVNIVGIAPLHYFIVYFNKLAKKGSKIVYFTSWPYWDFDDKYGRWVHRYPINFKEKWKEFLSNYADRIVCVNKYGYYSLQKYSSNVYWIPHSVDASIFKPATGRRIRDRVIVLFVGRLVRSKGIFELLEVAKKIKKSNLRNLEIWFVGNGIYKYLVKMYEHKLPVRYLGYIKNEKKLAKIYSCADILVLPSKYTRNWEELFGIVIIEAMSSGLPVIVSNHVGPREIINNNYDGFLIYADPSKNRKLFVDEIYKKIITLAEDEKLRNIMGRRGRQKVLKFYDVKINAKKWMEILKNFEL